MKHARRNAGHRPTTRSPRVPQPASERSTSLSCTASEAFDVLWATLADVIGPTATAALIQRSVKRASVAEPELLDVVIAREQFAYTYTLPKSWKRTPAQPTAALTQVIRQLWPMLAELTGSVVVRRLRQDPVLQRCGVIPKDADQ